MEPYNLAQMADDAILAAETTKSLGLKFESLDNFSDDKKQTINIEKTLYVHMSKQPETKPLPCGNSDISVSSLELGKSTSYLGLHLYHTHSLRDIIEFNLNKRKFNVAKYKSWLEVNQNTPISIKLLVLENCALSSIVYGFEA